MMKKTSYAVFRNKSKQRQAIIPLEQGNVLVQKSCDISGTLY